MQVVSPTRVFMQRLRVCAQKPWRSDDSKRGGGGEEGTSEHQLGFFRVGVGVRLPVWAGAEDAKLKSIASAAKAAHREHFNQ
jgi:hypothetical protein